MNCCSRALSSSRSLIASSSDGRGTGDWVLLAESGSEPAKLDGRSSVTPAGSDPAEEGVGSGPAVEGAGSGPVMEGAGSDAAGGAGSGPTEGGAADCRRDSFSCGRWRRERHAEMVNTVPLAACEQHGQGTYLMRQGCRTERALQ